MMSNDQRLRNTIQRYQTSLFIRQLPPVPTHDPRLYMQSFPSPPTHAPSAPSPPPVNPTLEQRRRASAELARRRHEIIEKLKKIYGEYQAAQRLEETPRTLNARRLLASEHREYLAKLRKLDERLGATR